MLFALLFSTLSFAAEPPVYKGFVQTSATAYTGETFHRRFAVTATYTFATAPQERAFTRQEYHCDFNDSGEPENCADYCETRVKFSLGSVLVSLFDQDYGRASMEILPLSGEVVRSELKGSRERCESLSLEGAKVFSKPVRAGLLGKNGTWLQVTVDPYDSATQAGDHIVLSTLRSLGGDNYEVLPSQLPASTRVWWSYSHTDRWGTSGDTRLELANESRP